MAYTKQRAVELHIAGGVDPSTPAAQSASPLASAVENTHAFHNAFTASRTAVSGQWQGPVPHETAIALASTTTFPAQPSVNKPGY